MRAFYSAFNSRDLETLLAALSEDVDWPNGWEGGRLHGREAVRSYWIHQWAELDPRVEPIAIAKRADGRIVVDVHQTALSPTGEMLWDGRVLHTYELCEGLVTRMDIEVQPSRV